MIEFTVPAVPVAQPRPRATAINGQARMYEAKASHPIHSFKATVRHAAAQAYRGPQLMGPLVVWMTFVFPRPKNRIWKTRPMPSEPHAKKPDIDNCVKSVLDALNGVLFADDSQVCNCNVVKRIASGDEQPHVAVTITPLPAGGGVEC